MNTRHFVRRSLLHHWRINLAVGLGVAAATAVLTGALLIGDSMRGSLRDLTLGRLGTIDELLVTQHFFREQLVDELQTDPDFKQHYHRATAAILFPQGTLQFHSDVPEQTPDSHQSNVHVAGNVLLLGVRELYWKFDLTEHSGSVHPGQNEIVLNQTLADELQVQVGDQVTLRLPENKQVSADSPLGNKDDRIHSIPRLTVSAIIPAKGLGRFSLNPSQQTSLNAYLDLEMLQQELRQRGNVNAILVSSRQQDQPPDAIGSEALQKALKPTIEDYGLLLNEVDLQYQRKEQDGPPSQVTVSRYYSLSSERMMLADEFVELANTATQNQAQPVLTYLANALMKVPNGESPKPEGGMVTGKRDKTTYGTIVPYSVVTAVDSNTALGPLINLKGEPIFVGDQEVVISDWLANDLQMERGDWLRIDYFQPETTHGNTEEYFIDLQVVDILPLTSPSRPFSRRKKAVFESPPTLITDPDLTPAVPGVTDQDSINDWDLPFPLIHRIRGQDDDYWNHHRTTPKAFVNLAVGKKLWGSRFGSATTMRIANTTDPDDLANATDLAHVLQQAAQDSGESFGMRFQPVKRNGLAAASGSTPFDGLFLGLSLFVIAAALMLIAVLFQLGIQQRASQLGLLLAVGLTRKQITRLLMKEAFLVACVGSLVGCALGVGYGRLMLTGLQTWWIDALVTSFLEFHITSRSLLIGYATGVIMSLGTIVWAMRSTKKLTPCMMLSGQAEATVVYSPNTGRRSRAIVIGLLLMGILLAVGAAIPGLSDRLGSEGQAGAFVGGGFCVLTSFLIGIRQFLRGGWNASSIRTITSPLAWLASRNAGRNPGRSTLTIGLMAMASFLLIAMGAFKLAPSEAGRGGFEYWGLSSMPVYENLAQEDLRIKIFGKQRAEKLQGESIQCLRFKSGDDASCSNVYQATQPRIMGIPQLFVDYYDAEKNDSFTWAMHTADATMARNPWHLLDSRTDAHTGTADNPVPVVIDKNTAMYSLKLYGGADQIFAVDYDERTIHFQVVGLLSNSILQGSLMISEKDFTRLFPNISGYRYFLSTHHKLAAWKDQMAQGDLSLMPNPEPPIGTDQILESHFNDQGLDMQSTQTLLASLLAVQNTYISAFQSLGALGLLLGTFGLATVQLRSILERRKELALMRATGYSAQRLAHLVLWENLVLLLSGLITGILAALFAVLPHMIFAQASPPGIDLLVMILIILLVGTISGFIAVRATLKAPLISALRSQ